MTSGSTQITHANEWALIACHELESALNSPLAVSHRRRTAVQVLQHHLRRGGEARAHAMSILGRLRGIRSAGGSPLEGEFCVRSSAMLPSAIRSLEDPPYVLRMVGESSLLDTQHLRVAIVGSRRPRPAAAGLAEAIARGCADSGITVVSGLAQGVDGAAHRGAMDAGGKTIAVLGSGTSHIYPSSHRGLAKKIASTGSLLLSEYAPTTAPKGYRFAHRNRIIAGLADLVVVVQAAERSGSLITAERALGVGIPVAVVPGAIDDPAYGGSTSLLRDGAHALIDVNGIARLLQTRITTAELHAYSRLLATPMSVNEIAAITNESEQTISEDLLDLELAQLVKRLSDNRYINS